MKAKAVAILMILSIFLTACGNDISGNVVADQQVKNSCFDSDGGKNRESFGTVKVTDPNGGTYEIKDRCIGNIYLIEGYCDGDEGKTQNFICQKFCDPFDNVCF